MRAKTIEYKHIMDDNAGGYYNQHVYIIHRIANMVVTDIIRQRICNSFRWFSQKFDIILKILLNNTKMSSYKNYFITQNDKEMYFEQFPPGIIITFHACFKIQLFYVSVSIHSHWTTC